MSKQMMMNIRVAVSAACVERGGGTIPEMHIPAVTAARSAIAMMKGTDVVLAVAQLMRDGVPLLVVFNQPSQLGKPETKEDQDRRLQHLQRR